MATTKTKKKGKTMALTDFLAGDSKLVTVRGTNWSEIVDSEEAESKPVGNKKEKQTAINEKKFIFDFSFH